MRGFQSLRDEFPFDFYEEVRAVGRPVWDDGMNGWLVVSNSGCRLIEMMEETHFTPPWYDTPPEVVRIARGSERALAAVRGEHHRAPHARGPAADAQQSEQGRRSGYQRNHVSCC
jgi:hypothetical protein